MSALRSGIKSGFSQARGVQWKPNPWAVSPVPTLLLAGATTNAASSYSAGGGAGTAISPLPNQPIYAAVWSEQTSGAASPTLTGNGLTWAVIGTTGVYATKRRGTLYRAIGAAPTTGVVSIGFAGVSQDGVAYHIIQVAGARTASDVVQVVVANSGAGTDVSCVSTLAALGDRRNIHLCFVAISTTASVTPDAAFTEIADGPAIATPGLTVESQWAVNQRVCTPTFSTAASGTMSLEIKALNA